MKKAILKILQHLQDYIFAGVFKEKMFEKFFKNIYFEEYLQTAASGQLCNRIRCLTIYTIY